MAHLWPIGRDTPLYEPTEGRHITSPDASTTDTDRGGAASAGGEGSTASDRPLDFLRAIVAAEVRAGKWGGGGDRSLYPTLDSIRAARPRVNNPSAPRSLPRSLPRPAP